MSKVLIGGGSGGLKKKNNKLQSSFILPPEKYFSMMPHNSAFRRRCGICGAIFLLSHLRHLAAPHCSCEIAKGRRSCPCTTGCNFPYRLGRCANRLASTDLMQCVDCVCQHCLPCHARRALKRARAMKHWSATKQSVALHKKI